MIAETKQKPIEDHKICITLSFVCVVDFPCVCRIAIWFIEFFSRLTYIDVLQFSRHFPMLSPETRVQFVALLLRYTQSEIKKNTYTQHHIVFIAHCTLLTFLRNAYFTSDHMWELIVNSFLSSLAQHMCTVYFCVRLVHFLHLLVCVCVCFFS